MPVTGHLKQPTQAAAETGHMLPLFGLAPGGVYPATAVTGSAVRSYRTLSPLPFRAVLLSVALSLESPPPDVIRRRASVGPDFPSPACAGAITRLSDPKS